MKVFWNDSNRGVLGTAPQEADLPEVLRLWSDEVHGVQGNFLGLVDDADRTIQFYYDESIPDEVGDAEGLAIVLMDFPQPDMRGSYAVTVRIGQVPALLEKAYAVGADPKRFEGARFQAW